MSAETIRVGLIGAGRNTREKHIPGLRAIKGVEIIAVCNRRAASTEQVAREYGIPRAYRHWEEVIADPEIDAIVIGTWPYLHCPITIAALRAGKHVLTEARMAMNAAEAHRMLAEAREHPDLVTQIVPSPFGLRGRRFVKKLLDEGYIGQLREALVVSRGGQLADPASPLSWRQDARLSGYNMLTLGIVQETLQRWIEPPVQVMAQVEAFIPSRIDPESGVRQPVGTPDSVQVLAVLESGARATYQFSGVTPFGQTTSIQLFGTRGAIVYDLLEDRILGATAAKQGAECRLEELQELEIPAELADRWRVEEDFIAAIRGERPVELTTFEEGVAYMEFTEAVARSAELQRPVSLPLAEFRKSGQP